MSLPHECWVRQMLHFSNSGRGLVGCPAMSLVSKFKQFSSTKHCCHWEGADADPWVMDVDELVEFCKT